MTGFPPGQHPGTTWHKIDLQCHSPRDLSWRPDTWLPGGTPEAEAERRAWADSFVAAAAERSLSIVAITDHHDVAFLPYVIEAAARSEHDIVVLPGIEITCRDAVQCLAIFDPATTHDDWHRLLSKLDDVPLSGPSEAKHLAAAPCALDIAGVFEKVSDDAVLAGRVVLLPHFGKEGAHKSLNEAGHARRAHDLPCDAVYIETPFEALEGVTLDKIRGRIPEWGRRRRAIIATGDNRFSDWRRLGAHTCWIKLGEMSAEGLRQAFLADEARITYAEPEVPSERIVEMEVMSLLTGPEPVRIVFNDGFTALIGGRGSGKSAILEYLRFGLGKSETDLVGDDRSGRQPREREARLIEDTLSDGWVKVVLEREGAREAWTRRGDAHDKIVVEQPDGEKETIAIATAQQRFPARAFHQRELSTTMVDQASAADNLTGIAAAEVIEDRRRIDREIGNAKRSIGTTLREAVAYWEAAAELDRARGATTDIRRRIDAVAAKLQEGGVGPEDMQAIADKSRFDRAGALFDEVGRVIQLESERLETARSSALSLDADRFREALTFSDAATLAREVEAKRAEIQAHLGAAQASLDALGETRRRAIAAFKVEEAAFHERHEAAKARQAAHRSLIADADRLRDELKAATAAEDAASAKAKSLRPAEARLTEARQALSVLVEQRRELLTRAADEVATKSAGALKARLARDKRPTEFVVSLCALFDGSRVREVEAQCQEWVDGLLAADGEGWEATCDALLGIYQAKIAAGGAGDPGAETAAAIRQSIFRNKASLTDQQVARIHSNLDDQKLGEILAAVPRDGIMLTYVSDGQSIDFKSASPGQQASALLRLLLRQSAGTLIVDQPEDDLDNRVMMEIVEMIRTSKSHRQIIFATHNPNLVVNGDADKVVTMIATVPEDRPGPDEPIIRVETDGAIETPSVRDAITRIMEGGLQAFDLRARKYRADADRI